MREKMMSPVRVFDKGMKSPVEIAGNRVGYGTSRRDGSTAWAEIRVYALDAGGYLLHRTGYSLIYHTAKTRCVTRDGRQRGEPASVDDLPDDAEPCQRCKPDDPVDLPDGDATVRFEYPRHTFDKCELPEEVVEKLTVIRNRDGSIHTLKSSQPVNDCLNDCARNDAAFAAFASRPVTF